MKDKIIEHAKKLYNSSPCVFDDDQISIIIENECKCTNCYTSIFELDDFPEVLKDEREVLCEECFDDLYRDICPICENYYDTKDVKGEDKSYPKSPFYWFNSLTKEDWIKYGYSQSKKYHPSGIYHAVKYPVFVSGCGGLGSAWIEWDHVEFICSIEDFIKEKFNGKWNEYDEWLSNPNRHDKAEFIGDCCWDVALKIRYKKIG